MGGFLALVKIGSRSKRAVSPRVKSRDRAVRPVSSPIKSNWPVPWANSLIRYVNTQGAQPVEITERALSVPNRYGRAFEPHQNVPNSSHVIYNDKQRYSSAFELPKNMTQHEPWAHQRSRNDRDSRQSRGPTLIISRLSIADYVVSA